LLSSWLKTQLAEKTAALGVFNVVVCCVEFIVRDCSEVCAALHTRQRNDDLSHEGESINTGSFRV